MTNRVAAEKIHEQECAATLIAIREGMVFHQKIRQVGGLAFNGRISRLAENRLVEVAENARQSLLSRMGKQRCRLTARYQRLFERIQALIPSLGESRRPPGWSAGSSSKPSS